MVAFDTNALQSLASASRGGGFGFVRSNQFGTPAIEGKDRRKFHLCA